VNRPYALHLPGHASPWAAGEADVAPRFGRFVHADAAAVWDGLDQASQVLAAHALPERIEILAAAAAALRQEGAGACTAALAHSTGLSPAGVRAAWDATFLPCDADALRRAVDAESLREHLASAASRRIVHVLAGNVLPASWSMLVRGYLVGAAQWLRPAQREPLFVSWIAHRLRAIAPELAAAVAITWWPHDDDGVTQAVLRGANTVTAQGDDEAVRELAAATARWAPQARFVGYGARWSAALVSHAAQTAATAAALARDIALFDQQGCLSPALILAADHPALPAWCEALAAALAALESGQPRGARDARDRAGLRLWRETMRWEVARGSARGLWESDGTTAWAVVLGGDGAPLDVPLDRHVAVLPFANRDAVRHALTARLPRLQGLALAAPEWPRAEIAAWLTLLHPARVAPPGMLQWAPPVWPQDHIAPLAALL